MYSIFGIIDDMRSVGQETGPKPLLFAPGARDEIVRMPLPVKQRFGYHLRDVQNGDTPVNATPFEGSRAGEIMKFSENYDGDTYRCVYAAKFPKAVYVLSVFQKKSKAGIATPRRDVQAAYHRFAQAKEDYAERFPE
jgi:phage-related protein